MERELNMQEVYRASYVLKPIIRETLLIGAPSGRQIMLGMPYFCAESATP